MNVEMILATDRQGGLGKEGRLPWPHLKEDMRRFQEITKEAISVMGRITYNDIKAAALERGRTVEDIAEHGILKGRTSIVLSSTLEEVEGASVKKTLRDVFNEYVQTDERIVVIGGEKLFIQAMAWVNVVHHTVIDDVYSCDRFFPVEKLASGAFAFEGDKITSEELECNVYFTTYSRRSPVVITL